MKNKELITLMLLLTAICLQLLILNSSKTNLEGPDITQEGFHEWYNLSRYNIAGTDEYQYVIDFVFTSEEDAVDFIRRYERLRE